MWSANNREAFIWINQEMLEAQGYIPTEIALIHEILHVAQADMLEDRQEKDIEQFVRMQADLIYEYEWRIKDLEEKLAKAEKR